MASKETLVLRSAEAPTSFVFPLRLRGFTAKLVDGQVVLSDRDGVGAGLSPLVTCWTRACVAWARHLRRVAYELVTTGGRTALKVTPDRGLADRPGPEIPG